MIVTALRPLEDQLGCFGYFGFASGVSLALFGTPDGPRGELYCNRCPKGQTCWQRHRDRVRTIFPELTALADEIAAKYEGVHYILELCRQTGQNPNNPLAEPYTCVLMGNMEDGAQIAHDQAPRDRGPGTLVWPLTVLS